MLTRPIFVRRLVPADKAAFDAVQAHNENLQENQEPQVYEGAWQTNPEGEVGEVVSENFIPFPDGAGGMIMLPKLGVCWQESRIPAIRYEDPTYLENVDDEMEDEDEGDGAAE